MKKLAVIWLAGVAVLFGCAADPAEGVPDPGGTPRSTFKIPPSEAVAMLEELLSELYGPGSRSGPAARRIATLEPIGLPATRSGGEAEDSLFYLVNFDDSMGFALLAADTRIEIPVFALTEKGNLSGKAFGEACESVPPENPATADTTVQDIPDYETFFRVIVGPRINSIIKGVLPIKPHKPDAPGGGPQRPPKPPVITYRYTYKCGPYLRTKWDQEDPFNRWAPIIGGTHAYAGCIPVALAQILNYHNEPYIYGGFCFNWKVINKVGNVDYKKQYDCEGDTLEMLAATIHRLGQLCKVSYEANATSSNIRKAKRALKELEYRNVKIHDTHLLKKTEAMLNNGKPVFMRGAGYKVSGGRAGHAWVVDGYATCIKYINGLIQPQGNNLIHANMGWRGEGDGYYASEIFYTHAPLDYDETDLDPKTGEGIPRKDEYTLGLDLKIIGYDLP